MLMQADFDDSYFDNTVKAIYFSDKTIFNKNYKHYNSFVDPKIMITLLGNEKSRIIVPFHMQLLHSNIVIVIADFIVFM